MRKAFHAIVAACGFWCLGASQAQASVIYDFEGTGVLGTDVLFTVTTPDFVNSFTSFPLSDLDTCKWQLVGPLYADCYAVVFSPDFDLDGSVLISYYFTNSNIGGYVFPAGSFTTAGTFQSANATATLTVTDTSAVPEPATWATLLFGFGAIGMAARRRRREAPRPA